MALNSFILSKLDHQMSKSWKGIAAHDIILFDNITNVYIVSYLLSLSAKGVHDWAYKYTRTLICLDRNYFDSLYKLHQAIIKIKMWVRFFELWLTYAKLKVYQWLEGGNDK